MNGCSSRVTTNLRMSGEIAARCGRLAERTSSHGDRADRLKPTNVLSKRDSYQRRGHLTVCKVAFYRLTLPRTRTKLTDPRIHPDFETTRCARSDRFILSRRAQHSLGTCKRTHARVVTLRRCATRPAMAAIDSVGPVLPTKIAKCIVIPRRVHSCPAHARNNSSRQGRVHKKNLFGAL
jgi:hypothetical protein